MSIDADSAARLEPESARLDEEREPWWRRTISIAFTVAVIALTIYLWPAMLGGTTRLVVVSGQSMEPTYDLRDIVVARDAGDTQVGDIVVFEVPEGEAEGLLIIHRVLEVDNEGFFITQGDNRDTPDQWQLTEDDIVGKPLARIPQGARGLGFIQNIWVIAVLVGIIVLFVLWPDNDETDDPDDQLHAVALPSEPVPEPAPELVRAQALDETEAFERDANWTLFPDVVVAARQVVTADDLAEIWLDRQLQRSLDDDAMADAVAWLDAQLADIEQPIGS